ncbi:cytochrome P450 [Actinomadura macrotermitis]|uniref:Methyl-branched lipid omega-hydroxylase n=1 Tax=Actinomadura macrotermitis TaxID=2585200 RepID=A0A7K0BWI2_9ACTN|nr:cytochrome P450 [Actinomadura macrotermitis]MQY05044.1 Methyl-branched lipid omega-hydroxylase [Actinomadura macrotermitis]
MGESATLPALGEIDLSDAGFWDRPPAERSAAFAVLRRQAGPIWFADPDYTDIGFERGTGYHALVRHADILAVSRRPELFCSGRGGATNILDMPDEYAEYFGSMINMDDPRHARLRRIVSRAFTRRSMADLSRQIDAVAARTVDAVAARGSCDFAVEVAARVPLAIICEMLGVPPEHHDFVFERSNRILCGFDPEFLPAPEKIAEQLLTAGSEIVDLVGDLAARRRERPADDLISHLVQANVDGESLTDQEVGSFFLLLAVAGNETTRNAITHGLMLLTDHPEQRELLASDLDRYGPGAVEEIVRLASPIIFMRRTVVEDCEVNGRRYREGEKALLFYWSANRDEDVFPDPERFDITRTPNDHVAFGAPGPHFCLGAHLARAEISATFRELLTRLPDIRAGEPDRLIGSAFINGVKHLPCTFTPAEARA